MPFGGNKWNTERLVPYSEMVTKIRSKYPNFHSQQSHSNETSKVSFSSNILNFEPCTVATSIFHNYIFLILKMYKVPGFIGEVGFISSISDNFCGSCNRLRLLADGSLKVCLLGSAEVSLRLVIYNLPALI